MEDNKEKDIFATVFTTVSLVFRKESDEVLEELFGTSNVTDIYKNNTVDEVITKCSQHIRDTIDNFNKKDEVSKDAPSKPIITKEARRDPALDNYTHIWNIAHCPKCNHVLFDYQENGFISLDKNEKYCSYCGTEIDFSDYPKSEQ